ncbi:MAG TPA: branched-chain amino acid ABC transporter permease [Firmicutes bacterium]|nr:branched-chain amino acid ABC transporter permease [Bacillota bacterium]
MIQQIINGLSVGGIYGLASVGYSLIYSVMGFSNFAHGELTMVGAFAAFFTMVALKLPFPVSLLTAMVSSGIFAVVMEKLAYRPLRLKGAPSMYFFIAAMGVSVFLQNIALVTLGGGFRSFPQVFGIKTIKIGPVAVGLVDLIVFVISVGAVQVAQLILLRTRVGKAIRAAAYDGTTASLMGINVDRICFIVFLMAGSLAGLAGLFRGMKYTVHANMGNIILKAFICAIFGGLGSVPGALAGSLLLGVIESLVAGFISSSYRDVFAFLLLIAILLFRPRGLMGQAAEEKA